MDGGVHSYSTRLHVYVNSGKCSLVAAVEKPSRSSNDPDANIDTLIAKKLVFIFTIHGLFISPILTRRNAFISFEFSDCTTRFAVVVTRDISSWP